MTERVHKSMFCAACHGSGRNAPHIALENIHGAIAVISGITLALIPTLCEECDGTGMLGSCEGHALPQPNDHQEAA